MLRVCVQVVWHFSDHPGASRRRAGRKTTDTLIQTEQDLQWIQIIAAPKKLDETGVGSRACEAEAEVEESF